MDGEINETEPLKGRDIELTPLNSLTTIQVLPPLNYIPSCHFSWPSMA